MPCVALTQKKIYRAYRARRRDRKIRNAQPIASNEKLNPKTAELVKTAAVAVEVATPAATTETVLKTTAQKKTKQTKAKKTPGILERGLKRLKTASLRRSAIKAARHAQATATKSHTETTESPAKSQTSPSASPAIRLKDGDRIQIRDRNVRSPKNAITKALAEAEAAAKSKNETKPASALAAPQELPAKSTKKTKKTKPAKTRTNATHVMTQTKKSKSSVMDKQTARMLKKNAKAGKKTKRRFRFRRPSRAELINAESRLGSMIFGPIPAGHRREFFHDRENIWIWHESWTDTERRARELTVRYEVRPSGVYKKLSAGKYFRLEGAELENFRKATRAYLSLIKQHIYHIA